MTEGYLFPRISRWPNTETPIRGRTPISAPDMIKALNVHARNTGERTAFTTHSIDNFITQDAQVETREKGWRGSE